MKTFCATLGVALIAGLAVAATGWCLVEPGETVVVRRLGRLMEPNWGAGLHWRFPMGIDRIDRVRSDAVQRMTIGAPADGTSIIESEPAAGEAMTGDLNLLRIQVTVQYRVGRPEDYVLHSDDVKPLLKRAAAASVSRALAAHGVDGVLWSERQSIAHEIELDLQKVSDHYQLGVTILAASLTEARPPSEVEADFAAAQSAESQQASRINEAKSYAETTTALAQSKAKAALESAKAAADRTKLTAQARAQRFISLQGEAQRARSLTIRRMYIEAMQSLLARVKRTIVVPAGEGIDLTVLGATEKPATKELPPTPPQAPARETDKKAGH